MSDEFTALIVEERDGQTTTSLQSLPLDRLPEGDVLVRVAYSSLNYKDSLALTGKGKVIRSFPMAPGIDFAGTVEASDSPAFHVGDEVILTGWGVGERHWGGFSQMARVRADWLVPLPPGLTLQHAMGIGTAGFTAMLCVMALEGAGLTPGGREVVVTGATGGVGSVAVAVLSKLGYEVVAATGKTEAHDYLRELGAKRVVGREELQPEGGPLASERWAGAIDTVGGDTLAGVLRAVARGGAVAACGNAGGVSLNTTVLPFILRGVSLLGIDSVMCPQGRRRRAWQRLAADLSREALERMTAVIPLRDVPQVANELLQGHMSGRTIVDVNA